MNKRTIFGLLTICCMLTACSTDQKQKSTNAVRVETEQVSRADANDFSTQYVGEVEAETSTSVSFMGNGTVQKILVSEGQHVSRGQLIAIMDETQCLNSLQSSKASMKQAQDAYDRMKLLHDHQSLSEMEWVQVQTNLEKAKSDVQMRQKNLADCRLTAPCSGVVGSKDIEAGMTAMTGQTVCRILDINRVKVKISVPEKEIMNIAPEATVTVDALGGEQFNSTGVERGVNADAVSRTYEVRYSVNNQDGKLLPGMVCSVQPHNLQISESQNLITLPITSVQRSADGKMFVWTVLHGLAHRTEVTLGKAQGNRIAILSGVKIGDSVVTKGYQKLNENCKVNE